MAAVKLLGQRESPFVGRVEIALKWKGVEYEFLQENLPNKSPLLLKYNPVHKKIPVFVHNGNPIAESLVIVEYIDETWKDNPILPQDPYQRAMARFWAKFIDDKCVPALRKSFWSKGEEQEKAKVEAVEALEILNNELEGKRFFGGDNIGLTDIAANYIALWVGACEQVFGNKLIIKEKYPNLCNWIEEYLMCSIIKKNLPDRDELVAYYQARYGSQSNCCCCVR